MHTINTDRLKIEVAKHIAADAVIQGKYWEDLRKFERLYGLPLPLMRICKRIFDHLPADEAKAFFADFAEAVERDGKDLTQIHLPFLFAELEALQPAIEAVQAVMEPVWNAPDAIRRQRDTILSLIRAA